MYEKFEEIVATVTSIIKIHIHAVNFFINRDLHSMYKFYFAVIVFLLLISKLFFAHLIFYKLW
jgi:hypothetical protein